MNDPRPPGKIFGVGLNKTGTLSLHHTLTALGYRSLHWGGAEAGAAIRRAIAEGVPLLTYLPGYDAYTDREELSYGFDVVDREYPASRFVLTLRDLGAWLDSRRRHVERNRRERAAGRYHGTFLEIDEAAWAADMVAHVRRVRGHFAGRPHDLLELDLSAGAGWEPLCVFLGQPAPPVPFPHANRDGSRAACPAGGPPGSGADP